MVYLLVESSADTMATQLVDLLVDCLVDSLEPLMAEMKVDSSASNLVEKMAGCWEHYLVGQSGSQRAGY